MKNRTYIKYRIAKKRFKRRFRSKEKLENRRKKKNQYFLDQKRILNGDESYEKLLNKLLPVNLAYLLNCSESDFHINKVSKNIPDNNGIFKVPTEFSITDKPKEGFEFIRVVLGALITQKYNKVFLDYSVCTRLDLGAQVFLDIILKDN